MSHLTRNDYGSALGLLAALEQAAARGEPAFLRVLPQALQSYVAFESAMLTEAVLDSGSEAAHRQGRLAVVVLSADAGRPLRLLLRRRVGAFSARDRERLALLEPHLAFLASRWRGGADAVVPIRVAPARSPRASHPKLTPREDDVMHWLSCGKTDADIAAFLSISKRTVHKHLEHIYEKLGVETRTAAVMAARRSANAAAVKAPAPSAR